MNQQMEQPQQEEKETRTSLLLQMIKWVLIVMGIAMLLALVGVVLGAANFMGGPIHYPLWILTTWFVVDVFLIVFILAHLALYLVGDNVEVIPAIMGSGAIIFVAGGLALFYKHLAWISFFAFLLLITMTIIDIVLFVQFHSSETHKG